MLWWVLAGMSAWGTGLCPDDADLTEGAWEGRPVGEGVPVDAQIVLYHPVADCTVEVDFEVIGLDSGFEQQRTATVEHPADHARVDVGLLPETSEMQVRVRAGGEELAAWTFITGSRESVRPTTSPLLEHLEVTLTRAASGSVTGEFRVQHSPSTDDALAAVELRREDTVLTERPAATVDLVGTMLFPADVPPLQTLCIDGRYVAADGQVGPPFEACGPVELVDEGSTSCASSGTGPVGGLVWLGPGLAALLWRRRPEGSRIRPRRGRRAP